MIAELRSKIQQHPFIAAGIIVACLLGIALIAVIVLGYGWHWPWVGVSGGHSKITTTTTATEQPPVKTLWDWLQLLIIPIVLVVGGFVLNSTTSRNEQRTTTANQHETALQSYIDKMSELLLGDKNLRKSRTEDEVRTIARARTLTVLRRLGEDGVRKGSVLQFLHESGLIYRGESIIDLSGADLRGIDLRADLNSASGAKLRKADLREADLREADLTLADLHRADLHGAKLHYIDLRGADLRGANLSHAHLSHAKLFAMQRSDQGNKMKERDSVLYEAMHRPANLSGADLFHAHLHEAYLSGADLRGADLREADLSGADLHEARYNTKPIQEEWDKQEGPVTLEPTQWRTEFDPKAAGAICVDCSTDAI